jgi:hypothetical protein
MAGVLGLTVFSVLTDRRGAGSGEVVIQADAADARVVIRRQGRVVTGPTQRRTFDLPPGDYQLSAEGGLTVEPPRVTVVRGGRARARVVARSLNKR